jgi:hypothetical protein
MGISSPSIICRFGPPREPVEVSRPKSRLLAAGIIPLAVGVLGDP